MLSRRRLWYILLVTPVLGAILIFVVPAMDALGHGPYSSWYNRRCQRIADEARLVGKPEADVVKVLGPPTFTYLQRTYNYAPIPWFPTAKFQVHCQDGVVIGTEQFDD